MRHFDMHDIQIHGDSLAKNFQDFIAKNGSNVKIFATGGLTIEKLVWWNMAKFADVQDPDYDVVILAGTNNIFKSFIRDQNARKCDFNLRDEILENLVKLSGFFSAKFKGKMVHFLPILPRGIKMTNDFINEVNALFKMKIDALKGSNLKMAKLDYGIFADKATGNVDGKFFNGDLLTLRRLTLPLA